MKLVCDRCGRTDVPLEQLWDEYQDRLMLVLCSDDGSCDKEWLRRNPPAAPSSSDPF